MSEDFRARLIGALYLLIFVLAPSGAKTATPLRVAGTLACDVAVAVLLYALLRRINSRVSLLAAIFRFVFVVVMSITALNYFGVTHLFQAAGSAEAFNEGYGWALVPFGAHCVLVGWLIWRSGFLPRMLGLLMTSAGAAYLMFLSPHAASRLFIPWLAVFGVAGEGSLTLWLLLVGVQQDRRAARRSLWNDQSR
ncbi:MAG TPA: DUF4386 domain-containing protein [Candidatus Acidoferrales bacterium]|nr:DUF4386 domain-containing protein [Candidatus Acidoferrales bacterium]